MVPGSRVDHTDSRPALIEVQAYHFSGVQAVVSGTTEEEEEPPIHDHDGSGTFVYISCFINSAAEGADFRLAALIGMVVVGLLVYFSHRRRGIAQF
jgi:hypothetical protein